MDGKKHTCWKNLPRWGVLAPESRLSTAFFYNGYFTWTDGEILFLHYAWSFHSLRNRFVVAVTSRGSNFPNLLLLSWTWWRHNGGMWQSNLWIPLVPPWLPWLEIRSEIKALVLSWLQETTWLPKKGRKEKQPNNEFCLSLLIKKSAELLLNMYIS